VNPLPHPPAAGRVLVLRLGAVGDVVRTLPAVSALRATYPEAHLAWLVEEPASSMVRGQPWVDEVIVFPRAALRADLQRLRIPSLAGSFARFANALRAKRFDLALDFHSILRSALLARASGAPLRVAYGRPFGREAAWLLANRRARLAPRRISRFERNLGLVRFLGSSAQPAPAPLRVDPAAARRVAAALGDGPPPVALHPGTSESTPHKRWTIEGYAAVAQALREQEGVISLVTFGPAREERAVAESIVERARGAARLAPETPTLADLAALFTRCRAYIGGDTGPLHVASLVGTPVVQILGPTDPVENEPYAGTPSRTVRVPVTCSPCRRGCAAATCMRVVSPVAVAGAARELLAASPARW
jgi:lipopolysaccharide heptosyltransferase I